MAVSNQVHSVTTAFSITLPVQVAVLWELHNIHKSGTEALARSPRGYVIRVAHDPDCRKTMSFGQRKQKPASSFRVVVTSVGLAHIVTDMPEECGYGWGIANAYIQSANILVVHSHLKHVRRNPSARGIGRCCLNKHKFKFMVGEVTNIYKLKIFPSTAHKQIIPGSHRTSNVKPFAAMALFIAPRHTCATLRDLAQRNANGAPARRRL